MSPEEMTEVNNNPLKIFKNFVNYAHPSGKSGLYYDVLSDKSTSSDSLCEYCHTKYTVKDQKYSPC